MYNAVMRPVIFTDRRGWLRRTLVRDGDGDEMAEYGLPAGPPDIEHGIDWEDIKKQINNILVNDNALTLYDLQRTNGIEKVSAIVKKAVYNLYREIELADRNNGHT